MPKQRGDAGGWTERTRRDLRRLMSWTLAWVVTMAVATFGPLEVWDSAGLTLLAILVNLAIGLGMIWANVRHLDTLDEMMRRIQVEAMALALGIGVVVGMSYSLLDSTDLISGDAEIGFVILLISLTYFGAVIVGSRRYR